jgi:hypothetical protein
LDLALLEPMAQAEQIASKYSKTPHWMLIAILGHSYPMRISSHVNSGSVEMHFLEQGSLSAVLTFGFL